MLSIVNEVTGEIYKQFSLFTQNLDAKASRFCLNLGLTMVAISSDNCGNHYWLVEEEW